MIRRASRQAKDLAIAVGYLQRSASYGVEPAQELLGTMAVDAGKGA